MIFELCYWFRGAYKAKIRAIAKQNGSTCGNDFLQQAELSRARPFKFATFRSDFTALTHLRSAQRLAVVGTAVDARAKKRSPA
jgi:hypothetical protein